MLHIGILAHSADGSALCYLEMVREGARRLGAHQHPEITMSLLPMGPTLPWWDALDLTKINAHLRATAQRLADAGCDFFVCPDNTAHIALDAAREPFPLPGLHICEVVAQRAKVEGRKRIALLGTRYTMQGPAYPAAFARNGLEMRVPNEEDQELLNRLIFDELCMGEITLRNDAAPIDRVDAREAHPLAETAVAEHRLHERLGVVECALDGNCLHIALAGSGHLPALHTRHAAVGEEDSDIDPLAAAEGLDRRTARIAGRSTDHGRPLAALRQDVVHQAREELHRHVFEGERRSVKELQQVVVRTDLNERRDSGVTEAGIGIVEHAGEGGVGDLAASEGADDLKGDIGIGAAGEIGQLAARQLRPALRQVEAAVAGETGENDVAEAQNRRFAAGRDIMHVTAAPPPGAAH
jgi:aspartate racemase